MRCVAPESGSVQSTKSLIVFVTRTSPLVWAIAPDKPKNADRTETNSTQFKRGSTAENLCVATNTLLLILFPLLKLFCKFGITCMSENLFQFPSPPSSPVQELLVNGCSRNFRSSLQNVRL